MRNVIIFVLGILLLFFLCFVCRAVDRARKNAQGVGAKVGMGHDGVVHELRDEISFFSSSGLGSPIRRSKRRMTMYSKASAGS